MLTASISSFNAWIRPFFRYLFHGWLFKFLLFFLPLIVDFSSTDDAEISSSSSLEHPFNSTDVAPISQFSNIDDVFVKASISHVYVTAEAPFITMFMALISQSFGIEHVYVLGLIFSFQHYTFISPCYRIDVYVHGFNFFLCILK